MPTSSNPVLTMLKADHKKVKALITEYYQAAPWNQKDLAQTTMKELEIHARVRRRAHLRRDSKGDQRRQADEFRH